MATHINAFYADVENKKQALVRAQGELDAAVQALKSHPDYVPEEQETVHVESEKPEEQSVQQGPQLFQKKR